jgi:hypothetical protein
MDPDPDPGSPKTYGFDGSRSATLQQSMSDVIRNNFIFNPDLTVQKVLGTGLYYQQKGFERLY